MGLILFVYGLVSVIIVACIVYEWFTAKIEGKNFWADVMTGIREIVNVYAIVTIILIVICSVISLTSYKSYLDLRADYDGVIAQYSQAIDLYKDKVVLNIDRAFTDLRYQGNSKVVGDLVADLRVKVANYNHDFIVKKKWKSNWLVGIFISAPDPDMKIINIYSKGE